MPKDEIEFSPTDAVAWTPCEGKVPELTERILTGTGRPGVVTRLLRFAPGTDTTPNGTLTHDFWEEVYILEGSMTDLRLGETFTAGMFACRPPGMEHGPWATEEGCLTFEVRYEAPSTPDDRSSR
ncbi:cupin domain-containing protein [Ruania alba]|uniref:ChrR Cupin-like domain-containing protein n=1 Tax=Ruania alba TaxID=648782 RepID=A0A1H5GWG0_9MICO|nr:cupin domain-containing protein [Ruania alba]SEE19854.1 ChrR Cupin-like domain-containing protein [Ruania alba]